MKNIEKYKSLLETGEVDALLLTSEYNRLYAAQYSIAEGVAVVTKDGAYYFTDSRYIEAAENNLPGFTVRMTHPGSSDIERINDIFADGLIPILADLLSILCVLGLMLYTDWQLTLISLIPFPIIIVATYYFKESVNKSFHRVRNAVSNLNAFVQEHILALQKLGQDRVAGGRRPQPFRLVGVCWVLQRCFQLGVIHLIDEPAHDHRQLASGHVQEAYRA